MGKVSIKSRESRDSRNRRNSIENEQTDSKRR